MIPLKTSVRGFILGEFKDRHGRDCSIQESSLAGEAAIWLGMDGNEPGESQRMLLNQKMAQDLASLLRYFARTGYLGQESTGEAFAIGNWVAGIGETNRGIEGRVIELIPGVSVTVQDNSKPGPEGRVSCDWHLADLIWAVIPPISQSEIPSRYERLASGGIL